MFCYRKATMEDLETIWNRSIAENSGDDRYIRWKKQFMDDNASGAAATFVIAADGIPIGEGTLLFSPDCRAVRGRTCLADGKVTANINALRIQKKYEGQGHISTMMKEMEKYAKRIGITQLTIGVEAAEARNLGIYLHWGYDRFILHEIEDNTLVLYYGKNL